MARHPYFERTVGRRRNNKECSWAQLDYLADLFGPQHTGAISQTISTGQEKVNGTEYAYRLGMGQ